MIDGLRDEGGDVAIPLRPFVYWSIILYRSELAILFLDKEEVCCVGAP